MARQRGLSIYLYEEHKDKSENSSLVFFVRFVRDFFLC